jgi:multiple sugar transport system ATP-binding protein
MVATIELKKVTKRFPDGILAVQKMDLKIADGQFVILVGPSGCGKSSILNMIAGLEDITSGELTSTDSESTSGHPRTATWPWCFSPMRCTRT